MFNIERVSDALCYSQSIFLTYERTIWGDRDDGGDCVEEYCQGEEDGHTLNTIFIFFNVVSIIGFSMLGLQNVIIFLTFLDYKVQKK